MSVVWNLWHGCQKISEGCLNCYMFRADERFNREGDSQEVHQTQSFNLPVRRLRTGAYKLPAGTLVYTCFTSDFFIAEADQWRPMAWEMMRQRPDLHFMMTTKRPERIAQCLPPDWGDTYRHVSIYCTIESQRQAERRLPIYNQLPLPNKGLVCEPLLTAIELAPYLVDSTIERVIAGGESGIGARECHFEWVEGLRRACVEQGIIFEFQQTGKHLVKDGRRYDIPRRLQRAQARKANVNYYPDGLKP